MQRLDRLLLVTLSPRGRRCDSRTIRITCFVPSFASLVRPTPESHPLECSDGTEVSKFKFLNENSTVFSIVRWNCRIVLAVNECKCDESGKMRIKSNI